MTSLIFRSLLLSSLFFSFTTLILTGPAASADDDMIRHDGDVMLAALFEGGKAGTCGTEDDVYDVQNAFAVQWFIDRLNKDNYIPGVTIGLEIRRLCQSEAHAAREAMKLIGIYITNDCNTTTPPLFGVIGPSTTSTATTVAEQFRYFPDSQKIPIVSASAAMGDHLSDYPNVFRIIPPEIAQIEAIVQLLLRLQWNYVAVVYAEGEDNKRKAAALKQIAEENEICVPLKTSFPLVTDQGSGSIAKDLRGTAEKSEIKGAIFLGDKAEAGRFLSILEEENAVMVIFTDVTDLSPTTAGRKDILSVTLPYRQVPEFTKAWKNLTEGCNNLPEKVTNNTWLATLKESVGCATLKKQSIKQALLPWYHIQAAAVFAAALKSLHSKHCQDSGPCPEFLKATKNYTGTNTTLGRKHWNLTHEFHNISSSFDELESFGFDQISQRFGYELHNLSCESGYCSVKVGNYTDNKWSLDNYDKDGTQAPWKSRQKAQCENMKDCLECIPRHLSEFALVIEGDFYFVASVPVHTTASNDPLKCDAARGNFGAEFVQAILFALNQVNQTEGRWKRELPNKTLGAIILDSCSSSLVLKNKLLQLHQGNNQSYWPLDPKQAEPPITSRILGYIGGFISDTSFAMSNILVPLLHGKPYVQLSPTSTATRLTDRQEHPFFMRLVESGDSLIAAIFDMLRALSASYVQIIYDSLDTYSEPLRASFQANATKHGVCLAQIINYQNQSVPNVLQRLRNFPGARVIIVILQFHKVDKLMGELTDADPKVGISPKDSFVFLGTDGWGRNVDVIKDTQKVTWGSLSISEEIAIDPDFADYFKTVDPFNTTNFWLKDYWEEKKKCHLNLSFRRRQERGACQATYRDDYIQDPTVSYYIQAVYAFASGVGKALAEENCDMSSNFICSDLTSKEIVEKMTNVSLDLFNTGESGRVFDSNGDGKNGYKFVQAYLDHGTMKYRQIGSWTQSGGLAMSVQVSELSKKLPSGFTQRTYHSACPNSYYCRLCLSSDGVPEIAATHTELPRIPVITGFVVLCFLLLIIVVVVIVLIRRHRNYVRSTINKSSHCPIRFENEGMSEFSVETSYSSQQPIQEIHPRDCVGSFLEHSDLQLRTSDYATIVHQANGDDPPSPQPPPPPCRVRSTSAASAYLTPAEGLMPVSSQDDVFLNGGQRKVNFMCKPRDGSHVPPPCHHNGT